MRRIITRLLMAKLIPVAIGYVTKAFRKNRAAAKQAKQNQAAKAEVLSDNEIQALEDNA